MNQKAVKERELKPINGFTMIVMMALIACASVVFSVVFFGIGLYYPGNMLIVLTLVVEGILAMGYKIVRPNESRIFTLFGKYYGTVKTAGFHYINPFCSSFTPIQRENSISLKTQSLDNGRQKVNDVLGNPIIIGAIVIWHVDNPTQAVFAVENFREYLGVQTDSTIRNVARLYPYDIFDDFDDDAGVGEKTLRGSAQEIAQTMQAELQVRVVNAGLVIEEVRITHLAYAEEIAAAMLQRQQAVAIIAARQKIVDGAVGMVKMAIEKLGEDGIILLDEERKANMVSNLLVVLVGNHDAQPIINAGTLY